MFFSLPRIVSFSSLCLIGGTVCAQDALLPLPQSGPQPLPLEYSQPDLRFLKPTKSIKPPVDKATQVCVSAKPQVNAPTVARLRRLILMPGGLTPEVMREQMAASGQGRQPVTILGMDAPAPILAKLANLFGDDVNEATQKQVVDTVRQGLDSGKFPAAARRVEVVGWLPAEGVMAVAVYPES